MTDYSDVPTVSTLHGEAERTQQAMDMLAAGGTMSSFVVAPPPVPPSSPGSSPTSGPMQMSVGISVTEPLSNEMITALNDWLTARLGNIVAELATYDVGPPPPPITDPPANTVVPVVTQVDPNLVCDTGTWDNSPSSYSYQWAKDGTPIVGPNLSTYPIAFADVGTTITCIVTATNAIGSTESPLSNGVVVVAPA